MMGVEIGGGFELTRSLNQRGTSEVFEYPPDYRTALYLGR